MSLSRGDVRARCLCVYGGVGSPGAGGGLAGHDGLGLERPAAAGDRSLLPSADHLREPVSTCTGSVRTRLSLDLSVCHCVVLAPATLIAAVDVLSILSDG